MLDKLFGSKLRAKVVGWLFTHPDESFFGRQLTILLGEDSTNISRELARLEEIGLLIRRDEGKQKYYQANPECPVFDELRGLVVKTAGLADILRGALAPMADRIKVAFMYGSFAEGRERRGSDVDVLVVGNATFAEVVSALGRAQELLRREINPTIYPPAEFRSKLAAGHHFVKSVLAQPKVFLIGDERELAGLAAGRVVD